MTKRQIIPVRDPDKMIDSVIIASEIDKSSL